jgi:hypothetical protein
MKTKDLTVILITAIAVSFITLSMLSAGYLAIYEWLRGLGFGFWQTVFIFATASTAISTAAVFVGKNK